MSLPGEKKIIISAAPISGPDLESGSRAGQLVGEKDRQANVVAEGAGVRVDQVRRIAEQYRNNNDLIGALIERDYVGPIADAQAAHEAASHRLALANARTEETGLTVLRCVRDRHAMADQVTSLVNPELICPRPTEPTPLPSDTGTGDTGAEDPADQAPRAFRHILERKLPKTAGYVVLAALAAAEGFLNIQAFAATGESSNGSFVLAVLVGIGVIGLADRVGACAADLLENRTGARGRSPARLAELALGIPSLVVGILGTAAIRARYYAVQNQAHPADHLDIPTVGLVALAFMLAATAVAVSMAIRNPFADDLARQDLAIADYRHDHQQARDEALEAQQAVSATAAVLRSLFGNVDWEYRIQASHVRQCAEAYLDSYCAAAGVRVTDQLPILEPPQLVASARSWLNANPVGTLAPPTLPFSAVREGGSTSPGPSPVPATDLPFADLPFSGNGSVRQES